MTAWLIAAAIAGTVIGIPIGWHAANCTHPAVGPTPPTSDRRREHPDQLLTATLTTPAGTRAALAITRRRRRRRRRRTPAARRRPQPIPGWGLFVRLRRLSNLRRLGRLPAVEDLPNPAGRQPHPRGQHLNRHAPPVRPADRSIPARNLPIPGSPPRHRPMQHHRPPQQHPGRQTVELACHETPLSWSRHPACRPPSAECSGPTRAQTGRSRRLARARTKAGPAAPEYC